VKNTGTAPLQKFVWIAIHRSAWQSALTFAARRCHLASYIVSPARSSGSIVTVARWSYPPSGLTIGAAAWFAVAARYPIERPDLRDRERVTRRAAVRLLLLRMRNAKGDQR